MFRPKLLGLFLILFCITGTAFSQKNTLSGTVNDTANNKKLQYAVISLLHPQDSTLIKFTRSDAAGRFSITGLDTGNVILMIAFPKFADYTDIVRVDSDSNIELGDISLINKSVLLNEIVIRQNMAMRMKGDTLEYTADSFKVRANASAEELLKAMPGIQVDKNGKIVAQGQEVQKILVDGEEFFSDDPTVATRNIRADAVDKVQVFDKKSDQAAFTGIDDGEKTKTINLKLKEDKKNGYFGKLSAGGGLRDKFSNEAMINYFKGKKKVSGYGIMSNTGQTRLNWDDARKYANTEENFEYDENSGFFYSFGSSDNFEFNGNGLPTMWTAGLHFSNKWNEDKYNINGSYTYKKLNIYGENETRTQNILPDTLFYTNQKSTNFSQRMRNSLSAKYEWQIDSSSSLKLIFNGYKGQSESRNRFFSESLNEKTNPVNNNNRNTSAASDESSLNTSLLWRKKFQKQGRTISARIEQKYTNTESEGYLGSLINYFAPDGSIHIRDTINQQKDNHNKYFSFNGKLTYTEPVSKDNYIELNYGYSNTTSSADRVTYDYVNGKYDELNELLTNDYDFLINTYAGGIAYRIAKKKYNIAFGSDLAYQAFKQTNNRENTSLSYDRTNLFPRFNLNYNFKPQTRLGFNYNGSTQQPTIQQVQPIPENEDPLNIFKGNPALDQAFNHRLSMYFNEYKVLKERGIWANVGLNVIDNAITTSNTVDASGRREFQSVNASGVYNYWGYLSYFFKPKAGSKLQISFDLNSNGGRSINFINTQKNITHNNSYSFGPGLGYYGNEKISFSVRGNASYNTSVSSINRDIKTDYWLYTGNVSFFKSLPFKFEVNTDASFNFRQKTAVFNQNRNAIIWNASLGKRLLKETCLLKLGVNDILNQNIGFNRNIQSNFISENAYLTLRRFWMVSFTWNFTKSAATQNGTP
ncbi:MAG: TonB-dependent receptor [Chitinophagaceae bacterium]|nr:TonB-dependent receptor [Chitinophagaceae bacterium]MCW5926203.1 TonB-dependent receptor [Chitinophagaceae bacterium]